MAIRVTVDADGGFDGYIDKGDFLIEDPDSLTFFEDWNRHIFRASESGQSLSLR